MLDLSLAGTLRRRPWKVPGARGAGQMKRKRPHRSPGPGAKERAQHPRRAIKAGGERGSGAGGPGLSVCALISLAGCGRSGQSGLRLICEMAERTYIEAIREGLSEEMTRDSDVYVLGEDVA